MRGERFNLSNKANENIHKFLFIGKTLDFELTFSKKRFKSSLSVPNLSVPILKIPEIFFSEV